MDGMTKGCHELKNNYWEKNEKKIQEEWQNKNTRLRTTVKISTADKKYKYRGSITVYKCLVALRVKQCTTRLDEL